MLISRKLLLERLARQISEEERAALEDDGRGLVISRYNRETVLRMLSPNMCDAEQKLILEEPAIDTARIDGLERTLEDYLNRYMREQPQGHKWIILSCLFLTFIAQEPMHPQEIVHWIRLNDRYQCPSREIQTGSLCLWCVCGQNMRSVTIHSRSGNIWDFVVLARKKSHMFPDLTVKAVTPHHKIFRCEAPVEPPAAEISHDGEDCE